MSIIIRPQSANFRIKVLFSDIKWEKDGQRIKLPKEAVFTLDGDFDIENDGAELLSAQYGYLVKSFKYQPESRLVVNKKKTISMRQAFHILKKRGYIV